MEVLLLMATSLPKECNVKWHPFAAISGDSLVMEPLLPFNVVVWSESR